MKISVVIPCFNEEKNISELVKEIQKIISKKDIEIILVNNGSSDMTKDILEKYTQTFSFIKVVNLEKNMGYGGGILEGLKNASGEILGWTHADLQTHPSDILKGLEFFEGKDKNLYVKGRRYGRKTLDRFFTIMMSIFEIFLLKKILIDINAQPTLFHKDFLTDWEDPPSDFSLDLYSYYLAKKKGYKIRRFPVYFGPRLHGHSTWNRGFKDRIKFIKRTFSYSIKLKKNSLIN